MLIHKSIIDSLRCPIDGSAVKSNDNELIKFEGGNEFPVTNNTPVLIDEKKSLFKIKDINSIKPITQSLNYRNNHVIKNFIRQSLLPSLSYDYKIDERYSNISSKIDSGNVLIIGAGDKVDYYKECYPNNIVITSDVHLQFGVDIVFDCHNIPFEDNSFSLIIIPQVLEHTQRPWIVAQELQRVVKKKGLLLIEVPFMFPCHGQPYDFYRFTPSALRFLFFKSELLSLSLLKALGVLLR